MNTNLQDTILKITDTAAETKDYTGEDGLLYCGKCHKPKEAYSPEGKTFSDVTATQQTATASGQPVKSSKPPKADRSTLKKWRT